MKEEILNRILDKINEFGIDNITILEELYMENYYSDNDAFINALLLKYNYYNEIHTKTHNNIYTDYNSREMNKIKNIWLNLDLDDKLLICKIYKINVDSDWNEISDEKKLKLERYINYYLLIF